VRRRERHVHVAALLDRLTGVERLDHRELAASLLEDARHAVQVLGPLTAGQSRPGVLVCPSGGGHRTVDIGPGGERHPSQRLLGRRIEHLEGALRPGS
jgi:hypothetical protein